MSRDADVQRDSSTAALCGSYHLGRCDMKLHEKQRVGAAAGCV